jgi:ribosomal protein S18 acetylase RimI-like enzyme
MNLSEKIILTDAKKTDISDIAQVAEKTWNKTYPGIITQEQIAFMLAKFYAAEVLTAVFDDANHRFFCLKENDTLIGFLHFLKTAENAFHLQKFYILPQYQQGGLGKKAFFEAVRRICSGDAPCEIRLNVNRCNFKAINFYFKIGFVIEEVKDIDIGNGFFMNDFIMLSKNASIYSLSDDKNIFL